MAQAAKKRKRERHLLRVIKGGLAPADGYTASRLREKGYRVGDVLLAELTKPRRPWFHKYAHKIGMLCVQNIEEFENLNGHEALKKLQLDSCLRCERAIGIDPKTGEIMEVLVPESIAFDRMEDGEFTELVHGLCRHIVNRYWRSMSPEQVAEMAEQMPDDV